MVHFLIMKKILFSYVKLPQTPSIFTFPTYTLLVRMSFYFGQIFHKKQETTHLDGL